MAALLPVGLGWMLTVCAALLGCSSNSGSEPAGSAGAGTEAASGSGGSSPEGTSSGGATSAGSWAAGGWVGSGAQPGFGGASAGSVDSAGGAGASGGGLGRGGAVTAGASNGGSTSGTSGIGGDLAGGTSARGGAPGETSSGGDSAACDPGTTTTDWATSCPTAPPSSCVAGDWIAGGPDPDHAGFQLLAETSHFAVYSDEAPTGAQAAADFLENTVWPTYFGDPIYLREPLCDSATKYKASLHVHSDWGLTGGAWASNRMGMWIGTGGLTDHWGLAHEFMHAVQSVEGGMSCGSGPNYCGWVYESNANFMPHQLPEYRDEVHCSEMLVNAPHLYLGSTRDRYCNWQFMEFLKDEYCYSAVNAIWTESPEDDPFSNIMKGQGWDIAQLNDFIGQWAMHNITWDYQNPPPTDGGSQSAIYRQSYGAITDTSLAERRLRLTQLEPLDDDWINDRRFQSPYFWAPQRFGYNVVRLYPETGATRVTVTFRGVTQPGANSDWRWGLVATDSDITSARYGTLQSGSDGASSLCVDAEELVWLVVAATPSVQQKIVWDQAYGTIYRYPYLVQIEGAWPEGYRDAKLPDCPSGTMRIANGGGCGPEGLASNVYVGPYAKVLGGNITGDARIEDHATILGGTISGGTVGALSVMSRFTVSDSAQVLTTFYPVDFFEGRSASGTAVLYGDVELRADRSSGTCSGFVDGSTCIVPQAEVTLAPPYSWR